MTASLLLALDLAAAVCTAATWVAAAVLGAGLRAPAATAAVPLRAPGAAVSETSAPDAGAVDAGAMDAGAVGAGAVDAEARPPGLRRRWGLGVIVTFVGGTLGVIAQGVFVALLAAHGWWFVQEKVLFAVPLAVAAAIAVVLLAGPNLGALPVGRIAPSPTACAALVGAVAAAVAGIVARLVVGYPLEPVPAAILVALVGLSAGVAWAVFTGRTTRAVTGVAALGVLLLVASVGVTWLTSAATPGALAVAHAHAAAPAPDGTAPAGDVSVTELRTPADSRGPLRSFDLTARQQEVTLASGRTVSAWTYGSLPGPELRVNQGDLVEVTLRNADIGEGVTIHWHGFDVPAGEDGVAGVTQDAVLPGDSFTYRFVATDTGTYWYHTHQVSAEGVRRGLFGALVVLPPGGVPEIVDLTVPIHTQSGAVVLGDSDEATTRTVPAGQTARLRLINTDQVPHRFHLDGGPFRVVAADGRDLVDPEPVTAKALRIAAGGRLDVSVVVPEAGVRLRTNASTTATLALAPQDSAGVPGTAESPAGTADLDLLDYGRGEGHTLPPGQGRVDATMVLDRHPRFLEGAPAYGYTVNGAVFPHVPSIEVSEGNTVRLTVVNRGLETHPMHVHGHHVLVRSRDGVPSTGSPLWLDTFDVQPGEVWVVEFVADNPGIWMDHCHNLDHAAEGMMMALTYRGVTSPFEQGGAHRNRSE